MMQQSMLVVTFNFKKKNSHSGLPRPAKALLSLFDDISISELPVRQQLFLFNGLK